MKKILLFAVILILIAVGIFGYSKFTSSKSKTAETSQTTSQEKGVLRIGQTIDEDGLEADKKEYQPFIDYLVSKLGDQGITKGEFVGVNSVSEMAQLTREGNIDIVIDSPFPVYVVDKLADAQPIANRCKEGVCSYHAAIFVPINSTIKTVADLKGKIIAMDGPTSTAAYFLPKAYLIKQGYKLTQKNSFKDPVAPDEIGYVFVGAKIFDDVANGVASVGVENDQEIQDHFGATFKQYRYVATTPDILRFLVAVRGNMDPKLENAIKTILFSMDQTPQGKQILASFAKTAKFTSVENTDAAYGVIKDLTDLVEAEIVRQ